MLISNVCSKINLINTTKIIYQKTIKSSNAQVSYNSLYCHYIDVLLLRDNNNV
jgi:hypothetical protein